MMETKPIGIYIHIPFCLGKCSYCDFVSAVHSDETKAKYIDALLKEIDSYREENPIAVNTIYFGGGTPSLIRGEWIKRIIEQIKKSFLVLDECEITLEANPKTVTLENLSAYRQAGVNRISLGIQSIHENELKKLGRLHNFQDIKDSVRIISEAGFSNFSADVMFGIPEQTVRSYEKTLRAVAELSPTHISAYGLIIEEGTPFFKMQGSLPLPSEDDERLMYFMTGKILSQYGFSHYEISNYAKPGYESRHNLKYWRCEEYIGIGAAAHSYFRGSRYSNTSDITEYLLVPQNKSKAYEAPDLRFEYIMLHLRLREGISLSDFFEKFGEDLMKTRESEIHRFCDGGLLTVSGDRIFLTEQGFYLSNSVISELV